MRKLAAEQSGRYRLQPCMNPWLIGALYALPLLWSGDYVNRAMLVKAPWKVVCEASAGPVS